MAKKTSISLGEHYDEFISQQVSLGRYSSAREVIRTALRLLEMEEEKKTALMKHLYWERKAGM